MMKRILTIIFLLVAVSSFAQTDPRLTQFDVKHYHIKADLTNLPGKQLKGSCEVKLFALQNNLQSVKLDLLVLKADSVKANNVLLSFSNPDPKEYVTVQLPTAMANGDSIELEIFYSGSPKITGSFGGFYFTPPYAFNLGVNITANPASVGRAWFPCADYFEDKAMFDFSITADSFNQALCNGRLINKIQPGNGTITWHWKLQEFISTYLASVAIAPYAVLEDQYARIDGGTDLITLASLPEDTTNLKGSFQNLKQVIRIFEENYGPHPYDRIGYNLVPFNSGAMEHATNIAYPVFANTGDVSFETLYGHELSHHWWGDNVTCESPSEMWLNEGWASYSEILLMEKLYGKERGRAEFADKLYRAVRYAHILDGGVYAVANVPQALTYGTHVYIKGALMAHTLRAYLGEPGFFNAIKHVMQTFRSKNWNTDDFKTALENFTGKNLAPYFDHWVKAPGFIAVTAHDLGTIYDGTKYITTVKVSQRRRWTPSYFSAIPVEIQVVGKTQESTTAIELHKKDTVITIVTSFMPQMIIADREEKLADAVTVMEAKCKSPGVQDLFYAGSSITTMATLTDSANVRVAQVWARPEEDLDNIWGVVRSANRYWTVDGDFVNGTDQLNLKLNYDGRRSIDQSYGWIDTGLIYSREDSLALLFRAKGSEDWVRYIDYLDTRGNLNDRYGSYTLTKLRKGDYVFVIEDGTLGLPKPVQKTWQIYPNPATDKLYLKGVKGKFTYRITDVQGLLLLSGDAMMDTDINTATLANGHYFLEVQEEDGTRQAEKFLVKK